jgi:hypothetical protein
MSDTTFTNGSTLTDAGWFNDVNDLVYSGTFPAGITNLNPDADDGAALGTSGTAWSDLFLASGAVINFNAGNYTITHSAGVLTLSGTVTVSGGAGASSISVPATGRIYFDGGSNTYIGEVGADILQFVTGGAEAGRITLAHYTKLSNSSTYNGATDAYHELHSDGNGSSLPIIVMKHSAATSTNQNGLYLQLTGDPNDATRYLFQLLGAGNERATMRSNGGLANYQANNVDLCDVDAKDVRGASDDHTAFVKALSFSKFSYKDTTEEDQLIDGVNAQDVEALDTSLVTQFSPGKKGVFSHRLQQRINSVIPKLIVRIEALEARLP